MTVRAWLDAVFGRRLLVRIWVQGVLLFGGILAALTVARFVLPGHDVLMLTRGRPQLALALISERVRDMTLAGADRESIERELFSLRSITWLNIALYRTDGALVAATRSPPAPPAEADRRALRPDRDHRELDGEWLTSRFLLGVFDGERPIAYAIAELRLPVLFFVHIFLLLVFAASITLLLVAVPLSRSIARPIARLGRLARELGSGNLAVRAASDRRDEIGDLARSFDEMAGQIQRLRAAEHELLADVSHELRTPLARIRVVLDLAADADIERSRRYLREIATDVSELEQLLAEIIASSRLQLDPGLWVQARPPLQRRALALDEIVDASIRRFRERWPDREIILRAAGEPLVVDGDPVLLRRALDNLVENARKYSPENEAIVVAISRHDQEPDAARVDVIDRGVGIAPADEPRLFSPFFRADRSRTRATGGVGLGLALARRMVEAHGGAVGYSPAPPLGSRFWFTLPLLPAERDPPGQAGLLTHG